MNKEIAGNRILNGCLPSVEYSVGSRGAISLTEHIGAIRRTRGKDTAGTRRFFQFLVDNRALQEFIHNSFTSNPQSHIRYGEFIPIGRWIQWSFSWSQDTNINWRTLHTLWNNTLPRNHRVM